MLELRTRTFLQWCLAGLLVPMLSAPNLAFSDAISVQNTTYFGRIVDVSSTTVLFDIECSGQVYSFDKQSVTGIFPEGNFVYTDVNGNKVSESVYGCSAPVDVEEASGGDGVNSAGINFCESFREMFGRDPSWSDNLMVVQAVLSDGSNDGLGTNDFYYFDDVEFRDGRPLGINFSNNSARLIRKKSTEDGIYVWRMWSDGDPILGVSPNYCDWN
ncbi:hypothetical protein [Rhodophyticola sp. CCM32]|uniref:hypothetical protein n=1 Tax=Rhodophyticola sp. CCM32 TaxID=2916397 RepID=UPI0011AEB692|nr:hypothetical protein [Rhodophyticola sp. CCM32]